MRFDLAFVLIDLGDPWYKQAACEMIRSARRAYKDYDMRVVQLTDSKTAHCPEADGVFGLQTEVHKEQMCQAKGHLIAEYALKADRPVIFCDVDIIWNNDDLLHPRRQRNHSIFLLWRDNMPSMPFNTGIIFSNQPERGAEFWREYRAVCDNLPGEICGWWGDQIAMAIVGNYFCNEADAAISADDVTQHLRMDDIAPAIDTLPSKPLSTPAVHFKGARKDMMIPYARMLDKEGFDFVRPGKTAIDNASKFYESLRQQTNAPKSKGWAF